MMLKLLALLLFHCKYHSTLRVIIIGGGAAGYFSSIHCANILREAKIPAEIVILESGKSFLSKVLISGGGRCNVMHDPSKGNQLIAKGYPRGNKELLSPFNSQFGPKDTYDWFSKIGKVPLKIEGDGRVFPLTDQSSTVIDALQRLAKELRIRQYSQHKVVNISQLQDGSETKFVLTYIGSPLSDLSTVEVSDNEALHQIECERIIMATGSAKDSYQVLASLGHTIEVPLPSLFSFQIKDSHLHALSGVSNQFTRVKLRVPPDWSKGPHKHLIRPTQSVIPSLTQTGPLLITQSGFSGPCILKLSAFGARLLAAMKYKFEIEINWFGDLTTEEMYEHLIRYRDLYPTRSYEKGFPPLQAAVDSTNQSDVDGDSSGIGTMSKRLWMYILSKRLNRSTPTWGTMDNKFVMQLSNELTKGIYFVEGRGLYKSEFVTCGGVSLKEIYFNSMQSKVIKGLFMAGEVLNIDGITGGYNFQSAWTTGYIAGKGCAESLIGHSSCD